MSIWIFQKLKREVLALKGGDSLSYNNFVLYNALTNKPVAKLSADLQKKLLGELRSYHVESLCDVNAPHGESVPHEEKVPCGSLCEVSVPHEGSKEPYGIPV